jgi:hypothetical protein
MIAHTQTQSITYGNIFFVIMTPSFEESIQTCFRVFFDSIISELFDFIFQTKSSTYFSSFIFQRIKPQSIPKSIQEKTYINVIFNQNTPINIAIAISFTKGDVIRNAKVIQSGIHHFKNHINSGILEQLQKGVIAQKNEAKKYSNQYSFLVDKKFLIFSTGKITFMKLII